MTAATRPLDAARARSIARAFLPASRVGNRWNYYYTRAKLGSDPLYPGVADALRGTRAPLLDLGCGLGLLAHTLREDGIALPYRGVDVDAKKIAQAQAVADRAGLHDAAFETVDLARGMPAHAGSVAILDVLQYVEPDVQARIVADAIAMLVPGARLVIRTGLDDGGRRLRLTRFADRFGCASHPAGIVGAPPHREGRGETLSGTRTHSRGRPGGRFGAHNLHPNFPGPLYKRLENTTVASWFNGGVRIFRAVEGPNGVPGAPAHVEEIGFYIPEAPAKNPSGTIQINHAIVDEKGLIYANDRFTGGLYILRYTGTVPMD